MRRSSIVRTVYFLLLVCILPATSFALNEPAMLKKTSQELYELRVYTLKNDAQQKLVEKYFEKAAIPAYNRLGIKHVGVFTELKPTGQTKLYVIIPFKSMKDFLGVQDKLAKDLAYTEAAKDYLTAPATAPAYDRIESSLMLAFAHMPVMEVPAVKAGLFELRRYESSGETAAKKKIEMFNDAGEIDIFKNVGMQPVFFGQTLIGSFQPNLTYMLAFEDMAAHDKLWKAFVSDPVWKKISAVPDYADAKIISHINSTFLIPTAYSQF